MKWFGGRAFSRACEATEQVPTPIGQLCFHCDELIKEDDWGYVMPLVQSYQDIRDVPYHYACFLRQTIGSLAHIQRRCSCYVPGSDESDPPGMTRRQAAEEALVAWECRRL